MSATPDPVHDDAPARAGTDLDAAMLAGLGDDDRFGHGVPPDRRASVDDFIQMTGITRPQPARAGSPKPDTAAGAPLDFFEAGVSDVDARARRNEEDARRHAFHDDDAPIGTGAAASAADAFRALVAQLGSVAPPGMAVDEDAAAPPQPAEESAASESHAAAWDDADLADAINAWTQPEDESGPEAVVVAEAAPPAEPSPPEALPIAPEADDFDAVIAAMAGADPIPDDLPPPPDAPPEPLPPVADRVREAESLIDALAHQPREPDAPPQPPAPPSAASAVPRIPLPDPPAPALAAWQAPPPPPPGGHLDDDGESESFPDADGEVDYGNITGRRHYGRHFARRSRRARRLIGAIAAAVVIALAGAAVYRNFVRPAVLNADQLLRAGQRAVAQGRHEEAARHFQQFADRFPAHPARPEALFDAGFYLQLPDRDKPTAAPARRAAAIDLLGRFAREYPSDPRSARARALLGVLHADLGNHDEAIEFLREPARQVDDPVAALPVLRRLANAHRMLGQHREAESIYLQAASLPKNFTPDADYYALGDMLQAEAALAADPATRAALRGRAADYWTRAAESPGIDPVEREKVENQIKWLRNLGEDAGDPEILSAPTVSPALPPAAGAAAPADELPDTDAAAEAAFVERNTAAATSPGGE